jgi:cysteinyl-tRNA synthetase
MTDLRFYNSLTRKKEVFQPIDPANISLYVCGPTVYSYAHIGNARPAIVFDTLRRVLEHFYPKVTHVANITDIDDKIIDAAHKTGEPISAITEKYTKIYNDDMASLGVRVPSIQPKATDHVTGMISMIETLIDKGHAYEKDGHVLFNVPSFDAYGQLSGHNRDEQIAGARVEVAPYKRDPADFVLWKPSTDDQPGWDSPWGTGRPGWHIECSVMASQYLGEVFDIHGGGLDLTFPHHENEIAQSCCASGKKTFARMWIHNGFVTVEGEKMSKSLGNVLLVHDMIDKGISGEAIRLAMLSTHYRQPFDWTEDGLKQAVKTLDKWYGLAGEEHGDIDQDFINALADDMNTPAAIVRLHKLSGGDLRASANILGLLTHTAEEWKILRHTKRDDDAEIDALVQEREEARSIKDFKRADDIRDQLSSMGVTLMDGVDGVTWTRDS